MRTHLLPINEGPKCRLRRVWRMVYRAGRILVVSVLFSMACGADKVSDDVPASAIIGQPSAPHCLKIYTSLGCKYCAFFHLKILPLIIKKYVDTGLARLELRDFPLDKKSARAAIIARSSHQIAYRKAMDVMFTHRDTWVDAPETKIDAILSDLAVKECGMDAAVIANNLNNETKLDEVLMSGLEGMRRYNIESTPTIVADNKVYDGDTEQEPIMSFIASILH